jgi:hypothetical protein
VLSEVDRLSEKRTQLEKLSDESLTEPAQDVLSEFTTNVELSITSEKVKVMVVSTEIEEVLSFGVVDNNVGGIQSFTLNPDD